METDPSTAPHGPEEQPSRGRTTTTTSTSSSRGMPPSNRIDPLDVIDSMGLPVPEDEEIDMIPSIPPPTEPERERSRSRDHAPAPHTPTSTVDYQVPPVSRPPSISSTVDYEAPPIEDTMPDRDEIPLP
eukprot:6488145-Amphidinium_carterae.1